MLYLEATRKGKIVDLDGHVLGDFGTEEDAQGFISNFLKPRWGGWLYRLPTPWLTPKGIDVLGADLKARGLRRLHGGFPKDQLWTNDPTRLDDRHRIEVVTDGVRKIHPCFGEALWVMFEHTRFYHSYTRLFTWERLDDGRWLCVQWRKEQTPTERPDIMHSKWVWVDTQVYESTYWEERDAQRV